MTNYTWKINKLQTLQNPHANFVVVVHWSLIGTHGDITVTINETTKLDSKQTESFVSFEELTENLVIAWIQNLLGEQTIENYKSNIQAGLNIKLNPPEVPKEVQLPWVSI